MIVRGIHGMTLGELVAQVKLGGRFVVFDWCVGLVGRTLRRPSAVYFVGPAERAPGERIWRTLASLLTGWWAVPTGPRETVACVKQNWAGGRDVTASVLKMLAARKVGSAASGAVTSQAA